VLAVLAVLEVLAVLAVHVSSLEARDGVSAPVAVVGVPGLSVVEDDAPESLDILGDRGPPDEGENIRLFIESVSEFISAEG